MGCSETNIKNEKSAQPDLSNEEIKRLVLLDTSYVYPVEQAKINALNLAAQLLDKNDGIKREISSFLTVPSRYSLEGKTSIKTDFGISKPETPSLYIANFNKKDGYVILSADKRATEILATVGSGTIDSIPHPGLQVFITESITYIDAKVAEMETFRNDATFNSMVEKLQIGLAKEESKQPKKAGRGQPCYNLRIPGRSAAACPGDDCNYIAYTMPIQTINVINYVRQPLLTTLWHQNAPYNNHQPSGGCKTGGCGGGSGGNDKYIAGCVSIAEAQVVAHFYAKRYSDWQSIVNKSCWLYSPTESEAVAKLVHAIYLDYGIYVDRTCNSVKAGVVWGEINTTDPRGIDNQYGLVEGKWRDWNAWDVRNSLINGTPVVATGMNDICCLPIINWPCWGCGVGHEWVIDGMRDLGIQTTYQINAQYRGADCSASQKNDRVSYTYTSTATTDTEIHQNWGWGENAGSGTDDWYKQYDFTDFKHQKRIVPYITPL